MRLAIIGTTCSVSPPCERSGSVRPERSCFAAAVPSTLCRVESDDDVADPVGRQLEALAGLLGR